MDIGARLQAVRLMTGLSQRELAKRAGVTNSTISLIEQNRVSPAVGSLKKVLDGIPMSMADFFTMDFSQDDEVFYKANEMPNIGSGNISFFLAGSNRKNRHMTILREIHTVGSDTGPELLSHEGEEGGVVVRGKMEITVAGKVEVLGVGDAYYFESRLPHRFRNAGDEECEIISANSPPTL